MSFFKIPWTMWRFTPQRFGSHRAHPDVGMPVRDNDRRQTRRRRPMMTDDDRCRPRGLATAMKATSALMSMRHIAKITVSMGPMHPA